MSFVKPHKLPGIILKIFFLGGINAFAIWSVPILISNRSYVYAIFVALSTLILDYIFLSSRYIPAKYIVPGALLMIAFQIYPAIYTGYVAFTNFSIGHEYDKQTAITSIISNSLEPVGDEPLLPMKISREVISGKTSILVREQEGSVIASSTSGAKVVPMSDVAISADGSIEAVKGYAILNETEVNLVLTELNDQLFPSQEEGVKYRVYDFTLVERLTPILRYDSNKDQVINNVNGTIYIPNENGSFESSSGEELEPGWTEVIGWKNFTKVFGDERYRAPLIRVLIWTFIFPFLVVLTTFFLGFLLALSLNHPRLRAKKIYRSLLVVPYAMPSVLSILTWKGMFNEEFGIINTVLPGAIPWLSDPIWAKVTVLIVQLWAGTPYMFLITTGAIQAIPSEIVEAAQVDGASTRKVFWNIKLPLVLLSLTPLLIASYAYNFSNFGAIYLLTGGGPTIIESGGLAGHTDILISYTYNLAFTSGKGRDYGLASAVSFFNFILVAIISTYAFRKAKTIENIS